MRDTVVLLDDSEGEGRLVAYIVPPSSTHGTGDLRTWLGSRLPEYMVPSLFLLISAIPLTQNGKVDRGALPAPKTGTIAAQACYVAPRTPLETQLAAIWQQSLGLTRVGMQESFLDLGGQSITAMRVVVRIRSALNLEVPVAWILQDPTIESLARFIDRMPAMAHNEEDLLRILEEIEKMPAAKGQEG